MQALWSMIVAAIPPCRMSLKLSRPVPRETKNRYSGKMPGPLISATRRDFQARMVVSDQSVSVNSLWFPWRSAGGGGRRVGVVISTISPALKIA